MPVIGVNYGRVGFLTAIAGAELDAALARVFAGDYRTVELATLEVTVAGETSVAINDVVVAGETLGRMIEVGYSIGDEELGSQPCDGLICATPAGSTAYNLSNGGPVLVWGLDAMVLTFVAPHALVHPPARRAARPGGDDHEPDAQPRRRPCSSTGRRSESSPPAPRPSSRVGSRPSCSRPCRR